MSTRPVVRRRSPVSPCGETSCRAKEEKVSSHGVERRASDVVPPRRLWRRRRHRIMPQSELDVMYRQVNTDMEEDLKHQSKLGINHDRVS